MPVVSREKISFGDKGDFKKEIVYSSKSKDFTIALPDWMAEIVGYDKICYHTEDGADKRFWEAYEEYKKRLTKRQKVIAYIVQINADVSSENGEECLLSKNDISFFEGDYAFGIGYKVLTESVYDDRKTYYDMENHRITLNGEWTIIDWTEQREKFFKETIKDLENLILRVNEFFQDNNKLLKLIDNKKYIKYNESP